MPQELEIRTTILAKKSSRKSSRKDANDNDVYADEALQLLQEIQQLKSSMQQTDERILGTYRKSPSRPKKKPAVESSGRKTVYDVVYPSIGSDRRRDVVVSHCLNPPEEPGFSYVPTTFTAAPVAPRRSCAEPASLTAEERIFRRRVETPPPMAAAAAAGTAATSSADGLVEPLILDSVRSGSGVRFKRIYADRASSPFDSTGEIMRCGESSSHEEDTRSRREEEEEEQDGESIRHASSPSPPSVLQAETSGIEQQQQQQTVLEHEETAAVTEAIAREVEDSSQPAPLEAADPVDEAKDKEEGARREERKKQERTRHYDRLEIRKYMQKQKKERKTAKESKMASAHTCRHSSTNRTSPNRRAELGLPPKPAVPALKKKFHPALGTTQTLRRAGSKEEENWGPYDLPNFMDVLVAPVTETPPKKVNESAKQLEKREKSIQTEAALSYLVDEGTQVSRSESVADEWLHILPSVRPVAQSPTPPPKPQPQPSATAEAPASTATQTLASDLVKPKPVVNLLRQIENLEHYIGNMLEAAPFQSLHQSVSSQPPPPPRVNKKDEAPVRVVHHLAGPQPLPSSQVFRKDEIPVARGAVAAPPSHFQHSTPITVTDGRRGRPPPTQMDTTSSTEYHPLPDRLTEYMRLSKRSKDTFDVRGEIFTAHPAFLPSGLGHPSADLKTFFPSSANGDGAAADAGLSSFFQLPPPRSRPPEEPPQQTYFRDFNEILQMDPTNNPMTERSNSWKRVPRSRPEEQRLPPSPPYNILAAISDELTKAQQNMNRNPSKATIPNNNSTSDSDMPSGLSVSDVSRAFERYQTAATAAAAAVPPPNYEKLLVDAAKNPRAEPPSGWKTVVRSGSQQQQQQQQQQPQHQQLSPSVRYNTLVAISEELAKAQKNMQRMPNRGAFNSTRGTELMTSALSTSDTSDVALQRSCPAQPPKNGLGSRIGNAETGSRTSNDEPQQTPLGNLMETTYLTLTPQYTSFDTTPAAVVPPNSSLLEEDKNKGDTSIFSARFSPIPRAVSPVSLVSSADSSLHPERISNKQSTSYSDRGSEQDRSVGSGIAEETVSKTVTKTPSPRQLPAQQTAATNRTGPEDLLSRLRSEMLRDESLLRSLQHVDRLEDSATRVDQQKRFRIQFDPETRSFFQSQTEALRAIAQDVRGGLAPASSSDAFIRGSQAAAEVDRIQSRTTTEVEQTYSSDFEQPSPTTTVNARSSTPETVPTTEEEPVKSANKRPGNTISTDSESALSDTSVLPPKAVDLLLQEEAKQQRLLLKLREKAQVEKTLAELELLQMQKRILRAQGDREKAASIKKKQRGLLLKLQEERARIEALRRQHKKDGQRSKTSAKEDQQYDSTFWETDWSNASASTATGNGSSAAASAAAAAATNAGTVAASPSESAASNHESSSVLDLADEAESSSSTIQPISEAIQAVADEDAKDGEDEEDDAERSQPSKSEPEANDSASALTGNLRLRAPLSPRTASATADSIRVRMKLRHRHSSGSDDSINLSQTETASDVSDVESRLLALTDQLQRRQAEAQRLKGEHKRISKEKLKAQESALIKQIEVYDRCITDLRSQLERDGEASGGASGGGGSGGGVGNNGAAVAVRPVIRQPRALTRTEEAKSPTSSSSTRNESVEGKAIELELSASTPVPPAQQPWSPRKAAAAATRAEASSASSSIATDIRSEASDDDQQKQSGDGSLRPAQEEGEKSAATDSIESELSSSIHDNAAEVLSDSGRADIFDQTMIIKSDSQVKEELADDIAKSILDQLVEETINVTTELVLKNRSTDKPSATHDVLQRVSAILTAGSEVSKGEQRSQQLYLTTTFDVSSPEEVKSPANPTENLRPSDVASQEGRNALELKLTELQSVENDEWIDDELEAVAAVQQPGINGSTESVIQDAEALEREQKWIEQEIQRLSSAAGSVLFLQREIPNKPPPPYTPPGQALNWQQPQQPHQQPQQQRIIRQPSFATEIQRIVPKSKDEVSRYCRRFAEFHLSHLGSHDDVVVPDELYVVDHPAPEQPAECQINQRAFMVLLADLSKTFVSELSQRATFLPAVKRTHPANGRPIRTREELIDAVEDAVLVQFSYRPRVRRESQLAKWSQKKRDRVDEILVRELQAEEKLWTDFTAEEVQVKRQTADAILEMLLVETATIYQQMLHQSNKKCVMK